MRRTIRNSQYPPQPADVPTMEVDVRGSDEPERAPGGRRRHSHALRAIMRERGFRRILLVRLSSQLADGLFQAGLAGSVLFNPQNAATPLAVAAGFAVLLLPYSLVGPYMGVLIDRWSRRAVIMATSLTRALLVLPAAAMIWTRQEGLAFVITTLVIIGIGRLFLSAVAASTPHVVEDRWLVSANAVGNTLGSIGYSIGLGCVAVLIKLGLPATYHGYAVVAVVAPVGYALSAILARWSYAPGELGPDTERHHHPSVREAVSVVGVRTWEGVRHLVARRPAYYPLLAQSAHRVFYGLLTLAVLLECSGAVSTHGDVGRSVSDMGGAFVGGAAGTVAGALVTPAIARRIGGWRWIMVLLAGTAVFVAAFGTPGASGLLPLAVAAVSATSQGVKIVVDTALQHECDDDFRGRVFSVNDTLFNICYVGGIYLGALTLPASGRSTAAILGVAVGYLAVVAWFGIAYRRLVAGRVRGAAPAAPRVPSQPGPRRLGTVPGH